MSMNRFIQVLWLASVGLFLFAGSLHAMPPLQHRVSGTIQSFDPQTRLLTIEPAKGNLPSSFLIKEGRTRLREGGRRVTLQQLPATGPVTVFYRTEIGLRVATEVSWRSESKKEKP